jgi:hypothetical protein
MGRVDATDEDCDSLVDAAEQRRFGVAPLFQARDTPAQILNLRLQCGVRDETRRNEAEGGDCRRHPLRHTPVSIRIGHRRTYPFIFSPSKITSNVTGVFGSVPETTSTIVWMSQIASFGIVIGIGNSHCVRRLEPSNICQGA